MRINWRMPHVRRQQVLADTKVETFTVSLSSNPSSKLKFSAVNHQGAIISIELDQVQATKLFELMMRSNLAEGIRARERLSRKEAS